MARAQIKTHESGMTSYNLDKLNDKQILSLFERFDLDDIRFIGISDERNNDRLMTKDGKVYFLTFYPLLLKEAEEITADNMGQFNIK